MSERGCEVTFEGNYGGTYYLPCDQVKYLDDDLTNTSANTIYMYKNKNYSNNRGEYIQIQSYRYPAHFDGSNYNGTYITNVHNVTFNGWGNMYRDTPLVDIGFQFIIMAVAICAILIKK